MIIRDDNTVLRSIITPEPILWNLRGPIGASLGLSLFSSSSAFGTLLGIHLYGNINDGWHGIF